LPNAAVSGLFVIEGTPRGGAAASMKSEEDADYAEDAEIRG